MSPAASNHRRPLPFVAVLRCQPRPTTSQCRPPPLASDQPPSPAICRPLSSPNAVHLPPLAATVHHYSPSLADHLLSSFAGASSRPPTVGRYLLANSHHHPSSSLVFCRCATPTIFHCRPPPTGCLPPPSFADRLLPLSFVGAHHHSPPPDTDPLPPSSSFAGRHRATSTASHHRPPPTIGRCPLTIILRRRPSSSIAIQH